MPSTDARFSAPPRNRRERKRITPAHFQPRRFFAPRKSETNYRSEQFYDRLQERWDSGGVRYIGDKVPFYYKDLFYIVETFPDCKILFLARDLEGVAAEPAEP